MTPDRTRPPRACISILNWNNAPATLECIASVRRSLNPTDVIVVLDNGSTDESVDTLSTVEGIELITAEQNLGFAGGQNRVLPHALARNFDYVRLPNNNALVQGASVQRLVKSTGTDAEKIHDLFATREKQATQTHRVIDRGTAPVVGMQTGDRLIWRKYASPLEFLKLLGWKLRLVHRQLAVLAGNPVAAAAMELGGRHGWLNLGGRFNREERLDLPARWLFDRARTAS